MESEEDTISALITDMMAMEEAGKGVLKEKRKSMVILDGPLGCTIRMYY